MATFGRLYQCSQLIRTPLKVEIRKHRTECLYTRRCFVSGGNDVLIDKPQIRLVAYHIAQ